MTTTSLLYLTTGTVGVTLMGFAILLARRGRFHWTSAGFWAWSAFALYFVVNPLFVALTGRNLELYEVRLAIAGGASRGTWILFVVLLGIGVFFIAYLRAGKKPIQERPGNSSLGRRVSLPGMAVLVLFLAFGFYSLIQFRTFSADQNVLIVGGRFVGDVTGYQNSGFNFLFFPTAFFLLSPSRLLQVLGWGSAMLFLALSLPHGWSRFTLVSMVILLALASTLRGRRRWPQFTWLLAILLMAAVLQVRGHSGWNYQNATFRLEQTATEAIRNAADVLAARDSAMLASFYLDSFRFDSFAGYQYGLPLLNYLLTGWIPLRLLPQKYFIIDWLQANQGMVPPTIDQLLHGTKSTIVGDLYRNGWLVGVILGMWALGRLNHKLDQVRISGNLVYKASALAILSQAWIIWGSGLTWGLVRLGFILMPAVGVWFTMRRPRACAIPGPGTLHEASKA